MLWVSWNSTGLGSFLLTQSTGPQRATNLTVSHVIAESSVLINNLQIYQGHSLLWSGTNPTYCNLKCDNKGAFYVTLWVGEWGVYSSVRLVFYLSPFLMASCFMTDSSCLRRLSSFMNCCGRKIIWWALHSGIKALISSGHFERVYLLPELIIIPLPGKFVLILCPLEVIEKSIHYIHMSKIRITFVSPSE